LVLLTDGLFEVLGPNDEEFGEHRVEEVLREQAGKAPSLLVDDLVNTARLFSATGEFNDDVCVLGVEVSHLEESASEELPP
jgi:serine phosphatase RsbU (regulator of sigma subunit)